MSEEARCRHCSNPAVKGPYCQDCADRMLTSAMTSPAATPPPQANPRRRKPRSRPRPASRPEQGSLFH